MIPLILVYLSAQIHEAATSASHGEVGYAMSQMNSIVGITLMLRALRENGVLFTDQEWSRFEHLSRWLQDVTYLIENAQKGDTQR